MNGDNILNKLCRVCFELHEDVISLYGLKDGSTVYEKLVNNTKLELSDDDRRLNAICVQCYDELNRMIKFIEKCDQANILFSKYKQNNLGDGEDSDDYFEEQDKFEDYYISSNNESKSNIVVQVSAAQNSKNVVPQENMCPYCSKTFTRRFNLKLHVMKHSGNIAIPKRAIKRHACPLPSCEKSFTSLNNLNIHIRFHNGERPYECSECGKAFRSTTTLNDHKRIHTGIKPYLCPVCGKRFTTNKLSEHMRTHAHARAPPVRTRAAPRAHVCVQCSARYCHKQSLNKHVRRRHGDTHA